MILYKEYSSSPIYNSILIKYFRKWVSYSYLKIGISLLVIFIIQQSPGNTLRALMHKPAIARHDKYTLFMLFRALNRNEEILFLELLKIEEHIVRRYLLSCLIHLVLAGS